jgi:hypothetical protein
MGGSQIKAGYSNPYNCLPPSSRESQGNYPYKTAVRGRGLFDCSP